MIAVGVAVPEGVDHARTGRFTRMLGRPRPRALIAFSGLSSVPFSVIRVGEARAVVDVDVVRLDSVECNSSGNLS